MPVVRITLDCATPTSHEDGAFRTFIAVTDAEFRDGVHIREAARRASIIGFGGPHRVLASRPFDAVAQEMATNLVHPNGEWAARRMRDRLEHILALGTAVEDDRPQPETTAQPTKTPQQPSARRAESGRGKTAR